MRRSTPDRRLLEGRIACALEGNDIVCGGDGDDTVYGGGGASDFCWGGPGLGDGVPACETILP